MKYVVMYLNEEDYEMKKKIEQFHFVRQVEPSYRPDVEMNFAEKIGTDAAYQVSDDGFDVEEKYDDSTGRKCITKVWVPIAPIFVAQKMTVTGILFFKKLWNLWRNAYACCCRRLSRKKN